MFKKFFNTRKVVRFSVKFIELASGDIFTLDNLTEKQIANMVVNGYDVIEREEA